MAHQFGRRGFDHGVGDMPRPGGDDSQGKSRKDVGVVGLRDRDSPSAYIHWLKRTARTDQRPSFGPVHQVLWSGFTARCRVGEWKDHRSLNMLSHFAHGFFSKGTSLS